MFIPVHPSNVQIIKLHMDKDRKALLARKAKARTKDAEKAQKIQEVINESVKETPDVKMGGVD